jgi:hypothetical protein
MPRTLALALLCASVRAALGQLTPDAPWGLPLGSLQYLSSSAGTSWQATSTLHGLTVPATVPGDLISDLQRAGVVGDPFYELGWLNTTTPGAQGAPLWDTGTWQYSAAFSLSAGLAAALAGGGTPYLVLDGVKMAADVAVNGVPCGAVVNDQFLRFAFPLPALQAANNNVTLTFTTSRDPRNAEGRFSGASGGWDVSGERGRRGGRTPRLHAPPPHALAHFTYPPPPTPHPPPHSPSLSTVGPLHGH